MSLLVGILVGGAARRMGGAAKGLLRAPDGETIVERLIAAFDTLGVPIVLVGDATAYTHLGQRSIADARSGIGPLGGLLALLREAGDARAIAVACDMPFVSGALIARLVESPLEAPIVAPRRDGKWEPLFARYDAPRVLPIATARAASGDHSLQRLLDDAGAVALLVDANEASELGDWDTPGDVSDERSRAPRSPRE